MVLLSAQGMDVLVPAQVTFTSQDRSGTCCAHFNLDGFDALYPGLCRRSAAELHYRPAARDQAGRPEPSLGPRLAVCDLELEQVGRLPGRRRVVDDLSDEGLRVLLHPEGVSFQVIKSGKQSAAPDFETKNNRIPFLYTLMDGTDEVQDNDPDVGLHPPACMGAAPAGGL